MIENNIYLLLFKHLMLEKHRKVIRAFFLFCLGDTEKEQYIGMSEITRHDLMRGYVCISFWFSILKFKKNTVLIMHGSSDLNL